MCNAYTVHPAVGSKELVALLSKVIGKRKSPLGTARGARRIVVNSSLQRCAGDSSCGKSEIHNARCDNFQPQVWPTALCPGGACCRS